MNRAFTLVELAIVIVIIGLLVGGTLAGRDLIKQAAITSTISQMRDYNNAVNTFKTKYNGKIPGDFNKAAAFGLDKDKQGNSNTSMIFLDATNNGDGDGYLESSANSIGVGGGGTGISFDGEVANFWVHLSNAGLIKETITQVYNCSNSIVGATACNGMAGQGFPASSVGIGILVSGANEVNGTFGPSRERYFELGVGTSNITNSGSGGTQTTGGGLNLTPEEASTIDIKLDDGKPSSGTVLSILALNCSSCTPKGIALAQNYLVSQACNSNATTYNVTTTTNACTLAIKAGF